MGPCWSDFVARLFVIDFFCNLIGLAVAAVGSDWERPCVIATTVKQVKRQRVRILIRLPLFSGA
jgi:hypothetical protein